MIKKGQRKFRKGKKKSEGRSSMSKEGQEKSGKYIKNQGEVGKL